MWRFSRRILRSLRCFGVHSTSARHRAVDHSSARRVGFWTYFFCSADAGRFAGAQDLRDTPHPRQPGSVLSGFCLLGVGLLMALLGFVYWSTAEGPTARALAAISRDRNVRARIVGIVCAAFLWCGRFFKRMARFAQALNWFERTGGHRADVCRGVRRDHSSLTPTTMGPLGLYMLTQAAGWGIVPDYLATFRRESYRWLVRH